MARRYQHMMEPLPKVKEMLAKGMTQKEVENALGLTGERHLLKREKKAIRGHGYSAKRYVK